MLYIAGMASAGNAGLDALVRGYAMGSISMSCYGLGADGLSCIDGEGAATVPSGVPAEQTNI
jgi:4,5-DOPA dioxygenase extradiol